MAYKHIGFDAEGRATSSQATAIAKGRGGKGLNQGCGHGNGIKRRKSIRGRTNSLGWLTRRRKCDGRDRGRRRAKDGAGFSRLYTKVAAGSPGGKAHRATRSSNIPEQTYRTLEYVTIWVYCVSSVFFACSGSVTYRERFLLS